MEFINVGINLVSWLMQCKFMKYPQIMHHIKIGGVSLPDNCLIIKLCIKKYEYKCLQQTGFVYTPADSIK